MSYAGDNVYVAVTMNSDDVQVKMRLHTCYTKPDPNADPRLTYPLIQNGYDSFSKFFAFLKYILYIG